MKAVISVTNSASAALSNIRKLISMIYTKFWSLHLFPQDRGKIDKIEINVKIKLPDNVKHSWVYQVYSTVPKGKAIFTEYNGTFRNTAI